MRRKFLFSALLGATFLFSQIGTAKAVTLADLTQPGGMIQCGDKWFTDFSYSVVGPDMPSAANVNVKCILDAEGNIGLEFQSGWLNPTPGTTEDALIGFTVTAHGGNLITDAHLTGNPFVLAGGDGTMSIVETLIPGGQMEIHDNVSGGVDDQKLLAWLDFPPVTSLQVRKDMIFHNGGGEPTLSFVDQTFSQTPEPGTLGLLVGMASAGGLLRLRRCRR